MALEAIFKLGYIMLAVSILIIIYTSLTSASHLKDTSEVHYPPCFFNSLCTCSKAVPDLGIVTCKNIPLPRIPQYINSSKVYMLHLENNGLRHIQPYFLQDTGLYRIEITWNSLTEITAEAFTGLERSLWELNLHHNRLRAVPSRSLRYLQKLKLLDLTGNEITDVTTENWRGLEESLETLILKDNGISSLQPGTFSMLHNLEHLDLSGNALLDIEGNVFRDGPFRLSKLLLSDNMFFSIPYQELSYLKNLRHLDLSLNRISEMQSSTPEPENRRGTLISLDTLKLDYNQIQYLPPGAFRNFPTINRTYLNGNPMSVIQDDAFQGSRIKELFLRDCGISELAPGALSGLENSLRFLDLGGNNLTILPQQLFNKFDSLRALILKDNLMTGINPGEAFNGFQYSLDRLDLSGRQNAVVALQDLRKIRSLRSLSLSKISDSYLSPNHFQGFGTDLEELKISDGTDQNVKGLKNHAFRDVRGLKKLDLSENSISTIENDAFIEIGHSLTTLNLAYGFSSDLTKLPHEAFRHLSSLEHLDLSNNKLKIIPETSFHFMKKLKILQLEDNNIEFIQKGTFQGDIHSRLEVIHLSFNQLSTLSSQTFVDLSFLQKLRLDDNKITKVEKQAFMNLDKLKTLNLRGNKISFLADETFQNLPELEELDLAYNRLRDFSYSCLDQVGTLSSFSLNVSHNVMRQLSANVSSFTSARLHTPVHANIKVMDFSHNNISYIERLYFKNVESSLTHLYFSHNQLINVTADVFGNLPHLQWLDLSSNQLERIEFDAFRNTRRLQVLYLSNNRLLDIPNEIFRNLYNLRVVELANNYLHGFPDQFFKDGAIERLDLSGNRLSQVPFASFKVETALSLIELDLSNNRIGALRTPDAFGRFKNLQWIDLSNNGLVSLEDGIFAYLPSLYSLDLSHNFDRGLDIRDRTFYGLDDSLEDLFLKNLSLTSIPEMHLSSLRWLDLSDNLITTIPIELSQNLSSLRKLELAGNQLTLVPPVINTLTQLRFLGLARNPIEALNFQQGSRLRELDIRHLPLTFFEVGVLGKIQSLQTLRLSPYRDVRDFNLPHLLQENHCLEHLHIEVYHQEGSSLGEEMRGPFPAKLRNLTLTGRGLKSLAPNLIQGIRNPRLNIIIRNTSIEHIPQSIFQNARHIRNLTIDVRSNRLRSFGNPNTGLLPNLPRRTFLLNLKIANNPWTCDCELGWIEGWERKRRQYICDVDSTDCIGSDDDLRNAICEKNFNSVIENLKSDIECGWGASGKTQSHLLLTFAFSTFIIWGKLI